MTTVADSVFGKVHLGYVVIETEKFDDWRRFGRDAIGMHLDETLPGVMRFRLDDNECRFLLQRGPAEDTTALGGSSTTMPPSRPSRRASQAHGVPVTEGSAEDAALRGVERFVRFPGPQRSDPGDVRQRPHGLVSHCTCSARVDSSPASTAWDMWPSPPRSRTRCAATTALSSTPGCATISTRRSTGSSSRSASSGSTSVTTPSRSLGERAADQSVSAPASSTATFRSPSLTT